MPRSTDEGAVFLDAVAAAQAAHPGRPSIVNGAIAAAIDGQFGHIRFTERTTGSELFVNPLMSLYFGFELAAVVRRSLSLTQLEDTDTVWDVVARIEAFRGNQCAKPWATTRTAKHAPARASPCERSWPSGFPGGVNAAWIPTPIDSGCTCCDL